MTTTDAYLAAFKMHVLSNQVLVQALIPGMKQAQYGRIVRAHSSSAQQEGHSEENGH